MALSPKPKTVDRMLTRNASMTGSFRSMTRMPRKLTSGRLVANAGLMKNSNVRAEQESDRRSQGSASQIPLISDFIGSAPPRVAQAPTTYRDHAARGSFEEIRPGDVIWIPPGEKHRHGASATTAMTHTAIQERLDGRTVDWMEKVSEQQYGQ